MLTCSLRTRRGLPSRPSTYVLFIAGTESAIARTMAHPMRWVKLTLPWPLRDRYPLMTLRLTSSSLAGTLRKLVAVGTPRLRSMFWAIATPAPRIGSPISSPAGAGDDGAAGAVATGAGAGVAASGAAGAGVSTVGAGAATAGAEVPGAR
jgi:hypothetical protein